MKRVVFIAAILASPCALAAQDHTAMWFVGHPAEMKAIMAECHNDPGRAKTTPDCENAFQAEVINSSAEAEAHAHLLTPPSDPAYWRYHPDELPQKLFVCARLPANLQKVNFCDSAREATK